jgi:hypothetical protein
MPWCANRTPPIVVGSSTPSRGGRLRTGDSSTGANPLATDRPPADAGRPEISSGIAPASLPQQPFEQGKIEVMSTFEAMGAIGNLVLIKPGFFIVFY